MHDKKYVHGFFNSGGVVSTTQEFDLGAEQQHNMHASVLFCRSDDIFLQYPLLYKCSMHPKSTILLTGFFSFVLAELRTLFR